jgi:hypothetical protein
MDPCYQPITDEMPDGGSRDMTTDVATVIRLFLMLYGYSGILAIGHSATDFPINLDSI